MSSRSAMNSSSGAGIEAITRRTSPRVTPGAALSGSPRVGLVPVFLRVTDATPFVRAPDRSLYRRLQHGERRLAVPALEPGADAEGQRDVRERRVAAREAEGDGQAEAREGLEEDVLERVVL